ncbi:MAG: MBL fold metallo-hydrolase, partial [Rectinemataceae bacterium]|nr:MBL fold metallo-hydrolase [Rectinemataceae bacterium]
MIKDEQPEPSTFELSLFGCGVGESIAIHVGGGDWILIDSCQKSKNDLPMALEYLQDIGVDPAKAVKLIVITHWHDDHIKGASDIVAKCSSARVAFSSALSAPEFLKTVANYTGENYIMDRETSGVRELGRILRILVERNKNAPGSNSQPIKTQADHLLHRNGSCEVHAISPSPASINKAFAEIAQLWKHHAGCSNRLTVPKPQSNHNSIAIWVRWEDRRALLGADLEITNDPTTGWTAALGCQRFPDGKASIFKIPHHGSPNGDSDDVWSELVEPKNPVVALTTFSCGATPRPTKEDIRR